MRQTFSKLLSAKDLDMLLNAHRAGHLSRDLLEELVADKLGPIEAMRWFRRMGAEGRLPPGE